MNQIKPKSVNPTTEQNKHINTEMPARAYLHVTSVIYIGNSYKQGFLKYERINQSTYQFTGEALKLALRSQLPSDVTS